MLGAKRYYLQYIFIFLCLFGGFIESKQGFKYDNTEIIESSNKIDSKILEIAENSKSAKIDIIESRDNLDSNITINPARQGVIHTPNSKDITDSMQNLESVLDSKDFGLLSQVTTAAPPQTPPAKVGGITPNVGGDIQNDVKNPKDSNGKIESKYVLQSKDSKDSSGNIESPLDSKERIESKSVAKSIDSKDTQDLKNLRDSKARVAQGRQGGNDIRDLQDSKSIKNSNDLRENIESKSVITNKDAKIESKTDAKDSMLDNSTPPPIPPRKGGGNNTQKDSMQTGQGAKLDKKADSIQKGQGVDSIQGGGNGAGQGVDNAMQQETDSMQGKQGDFIQKGQGVDSIHSMQGMRNAKDSKENIESKSVITNKDSKDTKGSIESALDSKGSVQDSGVISQVPSHIPPPSPHAKGGGITPNVGDDIQNDVKKPKDSNGKIESKYALQSKDSKDSSGKIESPLDSKERIESKSLAKSIDSKDMQDLKNLQDSKARVVQGRQGGNDIRDLQDSKSIKNSNDLSGNIESKSVITNKDAKIESKYVLQSKDYKDSNGKIESPLDSKVKIESKTDVKDSMLDNSTLPPIPPGQMVKRGDNTQKDSMQTGQGAKLDKKADSMQKGQRVDSIQGGENGAGQGVDNAMQQETDSMQRKQGDFIQKGQGVDSIHSMQGMKNTKDSKENIESKSEMANKDSKDVLQSKDSKDSSGKIESKSVAKSIDSKDTQDLKNLQDSKNNKASKDLKETQNTQDSKDIKNLQDLNDKDSSVPPQTPPAKGGGITPNVKRITPNVGGNGVEQGGNNAQKDSMQKGQGIDSKDLSQSKDSKDLKGIKDSNKKLDNKVDKKTDDKLDKKTDDKVDNKAEKKVDEKTEKKLDKTDEKVDEELDKKALKAAKKQKPLKVIQDSNPYNIDYNTLDRKYYPYIERSGKYYDADIVETIRKVNNAEKKSGVFLGILWGINLNIDTPKLLKDLDSINLNNPLNNPYIAPVNFLLFGLKIGYQSYIGQVLPLNTLGYQIFVDINSSFTQNAVFFTMLNAGLLYDFFESKNSGFGMTLYLNLGFGSVNITGLESRNIYEFGGKLDIGLSVRFAGKNKVNFSLINVLGGLQTGFVSFTPMIGYEYVF